MLRNCKTQEELKRLFKKLALRLHPDHGGSNELMILLKESYETQLSSVKKQKFDRPVFRWEQNSSENNKEKVKYSRANHYLQSSYVRETIIKDIVSLSIEKQCMLKGEFLEVVGKLNRDSYCSPQDYNDLIDLYNLMKTL